MSSIRNRLRACMIPTALIPALLFSGCAEGDLLTPATPDARLLSTAAATGSPNLVISQVYGAGGNSGALLTHDYVEIFNRGTEPASLDGLSIQYASATGTGNFGANSGQLTALPNATLQPGQYYLVQQVAGTGCSGAPCGSALSAPDATGAINLSATDGKVALVSGTTGLGCNGGSTPCNAEQRTRIVDLVGFGGANFFEGSAAAPRPSATLAALRADGGCTDTDNNAADFATGAPAPRNSATPAKPCASTEPPPSDDPPGIESCELAFTAAYTIQGSGMVTPLAGQTVTTQGVVVGDFEGAQPALRGFYLQDLNGDGDPATSDAVFVFNGGSDQVSLGDVVRVTGTATEFQGQTQVADVSALVKCGTGSVQPVDVRLPFADADYLERYEGMLVRFPQTLTVTEHFQLGRFGQVVMSAGGRLWQPTQVAAPGAAAGAVQASNDRNRIIVDDARNDQNPDPILFGRGGEPLSASNTLRGGDQATGIVGVMTYTWGGASVSGNAYRVRPVGALGGGVPGFVAANPRPLAPPSVGGTLKVAGFNLLNYFNEFRGCPNGVGGTVSNNNCRGAENETEFERQWHKTVAAILAMDVDVLGVIEMQNNGYDSNSAIAHLVDRLNEATAPGTYAFLDVDAATGQTNAAGTDAIKNAILYKPGRVTPVGATAVLNSVAFVNGGDTGPRNRPSVVQAFRQADGGRFVISVNHFKSKGSACNQADADDGQGNCNAVRVRAARELLRWLDTDPTGTGEADVLIVGDLNAYAKEDPIRELETGGFTNLAGHNVYSYAFDGQWGTLDYALASPTLTSQLSGAAKWHINADEPVVLDYNTNFKSPAQQQSLYSRDPFRVSDHDPVLVGMNLKPSYTVRGPLAPVASGPAPNVVAAGQNVPVRFSLGGNQGVGILARGFPASRPVSCTDGQPRGALAPIQSPGTSGLSYDAATDSYNIGWSTDRAWAGSCRELVVRFDDGSTERARFQFR